MAASNFSGSGSGNELAHKAWMPESMDLYKIVNSIRKSYNPRANKKYPWEEYLSQAIVSLTDEEIDWSRPNEDKLFFRYAIILSLKGFTG